MTILTGLVTTSCAVEDTASEASAVTRGASSLDPPRAPVERAVAPPTAAVVPGTQVGYYEMVFGAGQPYEVPPITSAGGTPVQIFDPSAASLAGLNTLFVTNGDNVGFGFGYTSRLADIQAAVQAGMILVIHDRAVTGAAAILPGGGGFGIVRDTDFEAADINIHDGSTLVTVGLDDVALDGGNRSSHGFVTAAGLPGNAKQLLSRPTADHLVTICYPFGKGAVIYSTIPLDFYLVNQGFPIAISATYAPNVVRYALAGACAQRGGPRPTPNQR